MSKIITTENWRIEFSKRFDHRNASKGFCDPVCEEDSSIDDIEKFIESLLKVQGREFYNELVVILDELEAWEEDGWNLHSEFGGRCCPGDDYADCYNRALNDVQKSKELRKYKGIPKRVSKT